MLEFGLTMSCLTFPLGMIPLTKGQGGTICQLRDLVLLKMPKLKAYLFEADQTKALPSEEDEDRKATSTDEEQETSLNFPEERWR